MEKKIPTGNKKRDGGDIQDDLTRLTGWLMVKEKRERLKRSLGPRDLYYTANYCTMIRKPNIQLLVHSSTHPFTHPTMHVSFVCVCVLITEI